jgi:hypothetical protein
VSVYHAIHTSPYADDCPDCAGYPEPIDEPTHWGWAVVLAVFVLAAVAAAWSVAR